MNPELDFIDPEQDDPLLSPVLDEPKKEKRKINQARFIFLCLLVAFALDFAAFFDVVPQTRILELIACRNYFDNHFPDRFPYPQDVPESECKLTPIQSEVAFVQGISGSLDAIPGILLLLPYGQLADSPRFGRRTVMLLSLTGVLLGVAWSLVVCTFYRMIPLRAIWFGGVFAIIGGGSGVTNAMAMTMISDVVDPAHRSTVYFQISLAGVVAQLLAPSIGSALMLKTGPWFPYYLGAGFFFFCSLLVYLLPETIPNETSTFDFEYTPLSLIEDDDTHTEQDERRHQPLPPRKSTIKRTLKSLFLQAWRESKTVFKNRTIILLMSTFFLSTLAQRQDDLLLLYTSIRYNTTISKAGFIRSIMACVSIVLLLVILPITSNYLTSSLRLPSNKKDLVLAKISIAFLVLGCFAVGLAPTIALMICGVIISTLGCGFGGSCLSMISTLVEPRYAARVYSLVSLIEMMGAFVGGPLVATLFRLGLNLEQSSWIGLPFYATGTVHSLVAIAVWFVRLPTSTFED
ncbi:hypothetical protein FQN57_005342 [Myotisia sp. PD_48]|nr:hypothetical protein FQN57_005342 [Myotisia sp. PD_48]